MTSEMKKVGYDLFHRLVCDEHLEYGPLHCCPWPHCPNGTSSDAIEAAAPASESKVYRRAVWTDADGEKSYSWESDLPLWFMLPRVLWREARRKGLVEKADSSERLLIYHYTSPESFLSILNSGELWMSDYSYLNDASELRYGLSLAKECFESAAKKLSSSTVVLRNWGSTIDRFNSRVCVASFSRDGDSLSQWRAYGPIAIGFKFESMMFGYANTVFMRPVIYVPDTQKRLLELTAHLCASAYAEDQKTHAADIVEKLYNDGSNRLLDVTAFLKHPAFAGEQEFRMVHIENPRVFEILPSSGHPTDSVHPEGYSSPTSRLAMWRIAYPTNCHLEKWSSAPVRMLNFCNEGPKNSFQREATARSSPMLCRTSPFIACNRKTTEDGRWTLPTRASPAAIGGLS